MRPGLGRPGAGSSRPRRSRTRARVAEPTEEHGRESQKPMLRAVVSASSGSRVRALGETADSGVGEENAREAWSILEMGIRVRVRKGLTRKSIGVDVYLRPREEPGALGGLLTVFCCLQRDLSLQQRHPGPRDPSEQLQLRHREVSHGFAFTSPSCDRPPHRPSPACRQLMEPGHLLA